MKRKQRDAEDDSTLLAQVCILHDSDKFFIRMSCLRKSCRNGNMLAPNLRMGIGRSIMRMTS